MEPAAIRDRAESPAVRPQLAPVFAPQPAGACIVEPLVAALLGPLDGARGGLVERLGGVSLRARGRRRRGREALAAGHSMRCPGVIMLLFAAPGRGRSLRSARLVDFLERVVAARLYAHAPSSLGSKVAALAIASTSPVRAPARPRRPTSPASSNAAASSRSTMYCTVCRCEHERRRRGLAPALSKMRRARGEDGLPPRPRALRRKSARRRRDPCPAPSPRPRRTQARAPPKSRSGSAASAPRSSRRPSASAP